MKSYELIEDAALLIERTGWTQGALSRDAKGGRLSIPGYNGDPPAACYCAYGAMCRVSWDYRDTLPMPSERVAANRMIDVAITALNGADGYSLAGFNDAHGRTAPEVLAMMRGAADKLRRAEVAPT